MILLIDNYDSFSYNLYQLVGSIAAGIPFRLGTEKVRICTGDFESDESSQNVAESSPDFTQENEKKGVAGVSAGTCGSAPEEEKLSSRPAGRKSQEVKVIRNDELTAEEIAALRPDGIILSPGPGRPEDAGVCIEVVEKLGGRIPIFGVCLGHQAICRAYGATVTYAKQLMHGKQSLCELDISCPIFRGCSPKTMVGRYHSLAAAEDTMPDCLQVIARTDDGEIMAVKHKEYEVYGLQFHPESILTPEGPRMLRNWVDTLNA